MLPLLPAAHHLPHFASQTNRSDSYEGYYAPLGRLVLLIICSGLLRKPIAVIRSKTRCLLGQRVGLLQDFNCFD
jgi:hypothetical protein